MVKCLLMMQLVIGSIPHGAGGGGISCFSQGATASLRKVVACILEKIMLSKNFILSLLLNNVFF